MLKLIVCEDWVAGRDAVLQRISEDVRQKQGNRILMVPELISFAMRQGTRPAGMQRCCPLHALPAEWRTVSALRQRSVWTTVDGSLPWRRLPVSCTAG